MELRRTPTIPDSRPRGKTKNEFALKWRQDLDSSYNFLSNPYTAWRVKRQSIESRISKNHPGYTQEQLEKTYEALGLGVDTDPGDFNREDSIWGSGSRAMSKAWNSAGMLKDSFDMWSADKRDDMERVMSEQEQLEDQALEIELIDKFQSTTAYGQNVVTQFLFDLASSAPIMAGVMVGGIALGTAATYFGAPFWLAGMLGMGVVDALSEMGFNWADIMTNPEVRRKIEASLGDKLSDADFDAIGEETQKLLMEEADTSVTKVGIANFFNPMNYIPALNKFSKLMKIGSGRMGTIGRQALVSATREGVEEFAQSVGSQYTAGEAQMRAMGKAGVEDIPQLDSPDLFQAGYEALMGFVVGAGFGGISGTRGYSKFFDSNSDMLGVDADGNPVFKQPNEKNFEGAGSLRNKTRKMVDASNPVLLDDWLNGTKEDGSYRLDPRERLIIQDELERMRYNKELLGDKTSPEKRRERSENAYDFEKYLEDKEGYIEDQKPQEQRDREAKEREEAEKAESKLKEEEEKILSEEEILKPVEVQVGQSIAIVNKEAAAKVQQILSKPANKRNEREIEYLRLAQENPDKTYKEIVKMIKERGTGDDFLSPKPKPIATPKKSRRKKDTGIDEDTEIDADTIFTETGETVSPLIKKVLTQIQTELKTSQEKVRVLEGGKPGAVVIDVDETGTEVSEVTLETIPTISRGILNKNDSVKEIMNTLNESAQGQNLTYSKKETQKLVLEEIRDLKKAQKIEPFKDVPLPDKTNKEGVLITGRTQKTDYDVSANDRLTILKSLSQKLRIPIQVREPTATADVDADVVEGTADTETAPEVDKKTKYNKPYDENGNEIIPKFPLEHLETLVNREVNREQPKTASFRYKYGETDVSAKPKGSESKIRTSDELVENPNTNITRLRYMGLNKAGVPYFNLVYVREDRTGSTVKGITVDQKEIIDPGAVMHLLSGRQKTFFGLNEVGKGKKKHKVADRSYATVTTLEDIPTSDQADMLTAIENEISTWTLEFDELADSIEKARAAAGQVLDANEFSGKDRFLRLQAHRKAVGADPKEVARLEELLELISTAQTEKAELLPEGQVADEVTVREGGERPEHVPLNALGSIQKDINKRQSNLRKKLKKNEDGLADITTNEEVDITLARIEAVFGEELGMDHDFGVQVEEENSKSITSLRMSKTTPISTSSLEYALRINGWELVNKDMDGLVENEIEVKVGENIPVKNIIKYTEDIIVGGINWTQRAKDQTKFLNEKTEESLKTASDEWWGTREGLSDAEKGSARRQAAGIVRDIDVQAAEETLPGFNWRRAARKWFTTAKAPKNPPKEGKSSKSGISTPDAIKMVRQQMKALDGVTNKSVDSTTNEQILEFLWEGPGEAGRPTIAATIRADEIDYLGVDVKFKNGETETIEVRWGQGIKRYQALAEVIANSNAQQVGLTPEGKQARRQQLKTALEKSKAGKKTAPEKKGREYSAAELAKLQRDANAKVEQEEDLTPKEEVKRAKELGEEVEEYTVVPDNELALINVKKGGELQKSIPPSDAKEYGSARFDKLRSLPKYRDASLWDASNIDINPKSPSKALTDQIKLDLGEDKPAGLKPLTDLIRRKLQDYLVLEIQTTEDVEGLKAEIDRKYWDLLVGPGHTAINNALKDRRSSKIDRGNKKTPAPSKKKDEKLTQPIQRAGFITDNVASAIITEIPTENPTLNDVWLLDPSETNDLFYEEAAKSQNAKTAAKNLAELEEFLALTNNGDFFVVKKTDQWSDAYILLRGDFNAPTKGKKGNKIPVPQAIRTRLSREGKFFNAQREDFPTDKQGRITQRSRKLVREELTNLKGTLSSELFMQLFRSQSVDLNVLQKALDEDRIRYAHDSGGDIDSYVEVAWRSEDGTNKTNGIDNIAMMKFNDRSQIEAFIEDIRKNNPKFDAADKQWKIMKAIADAKLRGKKAEVEEEFNESSIVDGSNAGITSVEDGIVYDSADVPLDSEQDVESDLEDIETWSEEEAGKDIGGKPEVRINNPAGPGTELLFKNPIPITSGSEQYSSEGVLWLGDAMNVGVTNKNNEEIGFKVTTDRNKGTLGIDVIPIEGPKSPKGAWPNMNKASIDAQWNKVFGAEKVTAIKNISFTEPEGNIYSTHPNISEALDKALDILLPGTRGYVNVSHVMQADTGITLGAGKPTVQQLPIKQGRPWSDEVIEEAQARVDAVYNAQEGGESLESKIARREQQLRDEAAKPGAVKRIADDPPEGTPPVALEVLYDIVGKFIKKFPGSADISVHTGKSPGFAGLYVPGSNRIYLVANQHFSEADVVKTLWHEGMGHGIENIITAEEFLELQQIVETSLPNRFQEELKIINSDKDFKKYSDAEKSSMAAKEVIAEFAEDLDGQNATVVDSIITWLRKVYNSFAKALGLKQLDDPLTEADLRAKLLETADAFRKPRPEGREDIVGENLITPEVDTSLRRRSSSFDRTSLSELDRAAWNKIYERKTDAKPGGWWKNIRQSLQWTIFDPYAILKDEIGPTQYMVSRLAGRADGVITTLLKYAGVKVKQTDVNGVLVNETVLDPTMKGLFTILKPLSTVEERKQFFGYGAYKRADFLRKPSSKYPKGRETFFSNAEIDRGLTWNQGMVKNAVTGTMVSREVLYDSLWKEVSAMNNAVVDIGVKLGLLSKISAENFQKEYYVPFYRIMEEEIGDGKNGNPVDYNSLTGQAGVKRLKGSGRPIGDPFNNLLHNWLHIIDASIKNDAANTTIRSALEITNPMDSSQMIVEPHYLPLDQSNTVRVKQDGVDKRFNINHDLLYKSLTALSSETKFPGFKHAIAAKGLFTKIVTAMPVFKYNNLVKDTITTAGTTDVGFNLINNAYAGIQSLRKDKLKKAEMLVSGAYIQFAYTRGDDPKYAETLLNKELSTGYIVENPETDQVFLAALKKANRMGRNLLDKYSKAGDMLENANRAKLFNKLLAEGKTQTEAAFESRDIMDFTLHGGADWVKLITSLTPFANAMLQGKYKVGRAIINNPKPAAIVAGMVVSASLFEAMYFEDDEEWQNRPEWDKDSFWEVKFPGTDTRFKIPKPHEFALVGNMAWRALDMARGNDPDYGGALVSGIKTLVSREFGIVPIPQIVKPLIEVAMNRNIFFDRDIEPMGSRMLSPSKRYGMYTSETAILASQLLEHLPVDTLRLSPYQLEHLINGYFGWIGKEILAVADMVTTSVGDFPERPARELTDHYMARRVFKTSPLRNIRAGTVFYERLKELEQAVQDANLARKLGHMDEYRDIYEEKGSLLKFKAFLRKKGRMVNDFNARIKRINFDLKMGADEKAVRIDRMYQLRNDLLNRITKSRPFQLSALR